MARSHTGLWRCHCALLAVFGALAVLGAPASGATISVTAPKKILHFSDVHLNISESLDAADSAAFLTRYGQDATVMLLESALAYAQHVLPQPDLFLYTGDHVAHGLFSDEYITKALETNVQMLEKFYPPSTHGMLETTAILGNADGNPDYYMDVTNPKKHVNPSIGKISKAWSDSLSPDDFDAFNRRGYLSYALDDKLLVLTLNTVPYSPSHLPDTSSNADPFGQFAWLNATLAGLKASGKFAYIAGHIAPIVDSYGGNPQWHPSYIATYKSIVGQYAGVVKAQLFGHVHSVEFRVAPAPVDAMSSTVGFELVPLFVSGSISPLFGNNPSFMVWDYDAETFDIRDFAVYGTNLSTVTDTSFDWHLLFRASEAYGLASLSNADLRDLYARLEASPALLDQYYWNMKAQARNAPPCTSDLCRAKTLCSLKWWTTKGEFLACVDGAKTATSIVNAIVNKANGGAGAAGTLQASDVYIAVCMTLFATVVLVGLVVTVVRGLRRSGVIKSAVQRENREKENFFPML